ncbi:MAG: glycosyl hydrolase, partial [Cytophagaceae bacterium]|nr:glycosyl hydrolase [Cytophagaceae bacterium]MDW8457146.1 glycosyl hydrolase [Cytophagaceae bacterium]
TISNAFVEARGITILGKHYGIFLPPGSSFGPYYGLSYNEANVPAEIPSANIIRDATNLFLPSGQNYFSIAVLPDNTHATLAYYAQFAFAFIINTQVSWSYNDALARVNSTFTITTSPQGSSIETRTLTALYRHQWLNTSNTLTAYEYVSPRGQMKVFMGNSFSTSIRNSGLLTALPWKGSYNTVQLYNYINSVYSDNLNNVAYHMNHLATLYDVGVRIERMVALVHAAHQVGHYTARNKFREYLKIAIQHWLSAPNGKSDQMFWYDPLWKTLVAYPQAYESDRQLNDHHFHYGYIIKGAATIVQYEPNDIWKNQWGPMVEMLIRDVSAWDRNDPLFPFLRNFDPYAGHSWASGHANFMQGNNQESSSEAINYNAAVALWGINTGNPTLRNLGLFLYVTEIAATQQYWFDVNNVVFPSAYTQSTCGIVWGRSCEYQTWFSGDPEHIHGINYLPLSGNSFYLAWDTLYPAINYNNMVASNGGPETAAAGWRDLFWMYQALYDPAAAKAKFAANAASYLPQTGLSKAYTYQWIHTLDSIGKPQAHITANVPTYGVFKRDRCYYYVVYNPPSNIPGNPYAGAKTVTFSDGFTAFVPPDTTIIFRRCEYELPVTLIYFNANLQDDSSVKLDWSTLDEWNVQEFQIQKSSDGINFYTFIYTNAIQNSASVKHYSTIDTEPYSPHTYYRLKIVDNDGKHTYSSVTCVNTLNSFSLSIFPNPTDESAVLQIISSCKTSVNYYITDMFGKKISGCTEHIQPHINQIQLNLHSIPSGSYVITVIFSNHFTQYLHFIKR